MILKCYHLYIKKYIINMLIIRKRLETLIILNNEVIEL